jgi:hypothetical protein
MMRYLVDRADASSCGAVGSDVADGGGGVFTVR